MEDLTDLIVVGAGPTGLTAAIEAARYGLSVRIIDKNETRSIYSKALVAHARTLEAFRDMGLVDAVIESGQIFTALNIYEQDKELARIVFEELDWKDALYPFWLSIPQSETERCLEQRLNELGVFVERQTELTNLEQHPDSVSLTLKHSDGTEETAKAAWILGSDGARSSTRKLLDLHFEGHADDDVFILADVKIEWDMPEEEGYNILTPDGVVLIVPLPEPHYHRLIFHMPELKPDDKPEITLASLQALTDERLHFPMKLTEMGWQSSFSVKHFVVSQHRKGRVFLAGDAAHIHSPIGGQGMNSGIQDAYNFVWKLALQARGHAKPALLNSYETERHQVAENLIKRVGMATQIVTTSHPIKQAIRNRLGNILISTDVAKNQLGRNIAMLDIHYHDSPVVAEDVLRKLPIQKVINNLQQNLYQFQKAPKSGYRAPNVVIQTDTPDTSQSLFDFYGGIHHTLLLLMGQDEPATMQALYEIAANIEARYQAPIRPLIIANKVTRIDGGAYPVIVDSDDHIHQAYGAWQPCLYLIRPDQYIAYRNQQLQPEALTRYLDNILK